MRNWLVWAEKRWSSDRAFERYVIGLPVKLLVEGSIAFIIAILARQAVHLAEGSKYVSYNVIPNIGSLIGTFSFVILFGTLWCDLVREREIS